MPHVNMSDVVVGKMLKVVAETRLCAKCRLSGKLQYIASQPGLHDTLNFETAGDGSSE